MLWMTRKARRALEAERRAELEALRAAIMDQVRAEFRPYLAIDRVDAEGRVNCYPIGAALRNVELANLNLKFFGYDLARRIAADHPPATDTRARTVGLGSKASVQADMESDWVAHWCGELRVPVIMHRKLWEFGFVLQALHDEGLLRAGMRGLGFGCGEEPMPSYLAAQGVETVVTDLDEARAREAGWAATNQYATLEKAFQPHLVDRATFDRLVRLEIVDMNAIPPHLTGFDFCWSICALEHLGSIANGLAFIENSLATLRPGGIAVHTMEYNIDPTGPTIDNWVTVLFQRGHLEALAGRLAAQGHMVAPFDFELGDRPLDRFIDLPPFGYDMAPELSRWHGEGAHLKVGIDGFVATCFGIIVRKSG